MKLLAALMILFGVAEAQGQMRSSSLTERNDKISKAFKDRNEKTRQAIVIPTRPSGLPTEAQGPQNAARYAIEHACRKAAEESKMVFVWCGTPPCGSCVAFYHYHGMHEVDEVLLKHYVVVQIDPKFMPDGAAMYKKLTGAREGAMVPFWIVLSPQKKVIADALMPPLAPGQPMRSAGFPSGAESEAHYFASLRRATPAITENEVRWLELQLRKAAAMPNLWKQAGDF
jgi:hypothetical protein